MSSKKKVAMVSPSPARAADLPIFADPALELRLIKTLRVLKNTRAYTVLEYHQSWASVHFEGDLEPTTVTYKN
jgi:hypothetical protein